MTNPRRITPAMVAEARAKAAGTYVYPNPVKATKAGKFNHRYGGRPLELATHNKAGTHIGPPRSKR